MNVKAMTKQMTLAAMVTAAASGCAFPGYQSHVMSEPPPPVPEPTVERPEYAEVVIDDQGGELPVPRRVDRGDPVAVIRFARSLSVAGRNREAGLIYLDAGERFVSIDGTFENDCRKAAVREFWADGDFTKAEAILQELEREQDIYARAAEEESLRELRKLFQARELVTRNKE